MNKLEIRNPVAQMSLETILNSSRRYYAKMNSLWGAPRVSRQVAAEIKRNFPALVSAGKTRKTRRAADQKKIVTTHPLARARRGRGRALGRP